MLLAVIKFMPVISNFIYGNGMIRDENSIYTVAYFLEKPLDIIYIYWNTFMRVGDDLMRGMFGGMLSWLDIKINWTFLVLLIICGLLLANVEEDRFQGSKKNRVVLGISCSATIFLVVLSMLFGYTAIRLNYVSGLQGRYLLPILPPLLLLFSNSMVNVKEKGCRKIWMTVIAAFIFIVIQIVSLVE